MVVPVVLSPSFFPLVVPVGSVRPDDDRAECEDPPLEPAPTHLCSHDSGGRPPPPPAPVPTPRPCCCCFCRASWNRCSDRARPAAALTLRRTPPGADDVADLGDSDAARDDGDGDGDRDKDRDLSDRVRSSSFCTRADNQPPPETDRDAAISDHSGRSPLAKSRPVFSPGDPDLEPPSRMRLVAAGEEPAPPGPPAAAAAAAAAAAGPAAPGPPRVPLEPVWCSRARRWRTAAAATVDG